MRRGADWKQGSGLKKALAYSIVSFWLIMAALFVRREVIPSLYAQPLMGYAALRAYAQLNAGYQMGVFTPNQTRIGTVKTTYQFKANGNCEIATKTTIDLEKSSLFARALGSPKLRDNRLFELWSNVIIGPDSRLKQFQIACDSPVLSGFVDGSVKGNSIRLTLNYEGTRTETAIPITEDDVISSGFMAVGTLPDLQVGRSWRLRMFDPISFSFSTATARVRRHTKIHLRGEWYPVYEVELHHGPVVARAWVNESGDVLKEEAFAVVLIREPLPHEEPPRPIRSPTTKPAAQ